MIKTPEEKEFDEKMEKLVDGDIEKKTFWSKKLIIKIMV
jgi:hypothetical protein